MRMRSVSPSLIAMLVVLMSTALAANGGKHDAQLVRCSLTTSDKCTLTEATLQTPKEPLEKAPAKPASGVKGLFKELRPGSCRSAVPKQPYSSWPARGEAAITFCNP